MRARLPVIPRVARCACVIVVVKYCAGVRFRRAVSLAVRWRVAMRRSPAVLAGVVGGRMSGAVGQRAAGMHDRVRGGIAGYGQGRDGCVVGGATRG